MGHLPEVLANWLAQHYPQRQTVRAQPIDPDGSNRSFFRLSIGQQELVLLHSPDNLPEAHAWFCFNQHLASLGLPVPALVAAQTQRGIFLMQDLGKQSLQQAALACAGDSAKLAELYQPVLKLNATMHALGCKGMDLAWCFDSKALDAPFLRAREMDYFYKQVVLKLNLNSAKALQQELELAAQRAAAAQPWGLVHRDMQSRNIVLNSQGELGLVDFQGARPGPVQYDVASLLNDPYVDLPIALRAELLRFYVEQLAGLQDFDEALFYQGFPWVALSRNLQAMGAYMFLSTEKGKRHFLAYMAPAARNLARLLAGNGLEDLACLQSIAGQLLELDFDALPQNQPG